jgi:hypothetical protein
VTSGLVLLLQQGRIVTGIVAGGLLGIANLSWMVGTAGRLARAGAGPRAHTLTGFIRFLAVGALLGSLLVVGRVHPVGAVIGYGLFPITAAVAGWRAMSPFKMAAS